MALVTAESVAAAAEALAARGERISVASVRKEIGGGSPNALAPLVASWKAARATAEPDAAPEDSAPPVPAGPPAAVPDLRRISAAMTDLAAAVLADVTERIEAVQGEADARVQAEREAAARVAEQHVPPWPPSSATATPRGARPPRRRTRRRRRWWRWRR